LRPCGSSYSYHAVYSELLCIIVLHWTVIWV